MVKKSEKLRGSLDIPRKKRENIKIDKLPPEVLQRAYQEFLDANLSYASSILGRDYVASWLKETLEKIRICSAGTEFFIPQENRIVVTDILNAKSRNLLSLKQIHKVYSEIIKRLKNILLDYEMMDFEELLNRKIQDYTLEKLCILTEKIEMLEDLFSKVINKNQEKTTSDC